MRLVVYVVLGCLLAGTSACNKPMTDDSKTKSAQTSHDAKASLPTPSAAVPEENSIIAGIKHQKLAKYPKITIGDAVKQYSFFTSSAWSVAQTAKGNIYVDVVGWFDPVKNPAPSLTKKGVEIKFSVDPEGEFSVVMVSRAEIDNNGKLLKYPLTDKDSVLKALYTDKKMDI